jgi:hypothetical protein
MDLLSQLLLDFSQHAAPLAHTESLEDFKQQARGVCAEVQFSPQQLHAVRDQLQALGSSGWQQFGADGVVPTDVARWGGGVGQWQLPASPDSHTADVHRTH